MTTRECFVMDSHNNIFIMQGSMHFLDFLTLQGNMRNEKTEKFHRGTYVPMAVEFRCLFPCKNILNLFFISSSNSLSVLFVPSGFIRLTTCGSVKFQSLSYNFGFTPFLTMTKKQLPFIYNKSSISLFCHAP